MKKMIIGLTCLFSLAGFAQEFKEDKRSVGNTLERVELENNAVCKFKRSTRGISNMMFSWNFQYYNCVGNEGAFELKFWVKSTRDINRPVLPGDRSVYIAPVVTRIVISPVK